MKKNLSLAVLLSVLLFSCRPKVIYVDRPVNNTPNTSSNTPPASNNDNQVYQPAPAPAYVPPANNNQQNNANESQQQYNNAVQNNNGDQQNYKDQNQNNYQESDQQYYANQQQVNYASSSYQTFYDELSPYGSWVNYQGYGYVWVPAQGPGFTPYATNGYWVYTQYGMTWQSNYNWGWAPFHYGSWTLDPFYGWLWIPGNTWAPAQVVWGQYNGYYGWAPIGPGYYPGYRPAPNYWTFVRQEHISDPYPNNYMVYHEDNPVIPNNNINNVVIVNHTGTYNNAAYNSGPQREEIQTVTGHPVQVVNISETPKPVPAHQAIKTNNLSIYRPAIAKATAINAAPAHIVPIENVKTVNATAVHGTLPRQNTNANPPVRQNEPHQSEPVQNRPTQPTQPIRETPEQPRPVDRKPEPVQRNPNPNTNQNQNRQVNPKPKPQPKPAPRPQSQKGVK